MNNIVFFCIFESENWCIEKEYFDRIFLWKLDCYFVFLQKYEIFHLSLKPKNIEKRMQNIFKIRSFDNDINKIQVVYIMDSDDAHKSKTYKKNRESINNNITKICGQKFKINKSNIEIIELIPTNSSCFEEFIYYHLDHKKIVNRNYASNIKKHNNTICKNLNFKNIDELKTEKGIGKFFRKMFSNEKSISKTFGNIKKNCNTFNSIYKKILK